MIVKVLKNQLLSIIVPVYNGEGTIQHCLDCIYRSSYKNFEVIVVNDCSKDSTVEKLKGHSCRLVNLKKNGGVANARNIGAKNAKGQLLVFVDADIYVHKNTFSKMLDAYNSNPGIKIIGASDSGKCFGTKFSSKFCKLKLMHGYNWRENETLRKFSSFQSECSLCDKKVFEELGGFSTIYRQAGVEEYEFGDRLIKKGYMNYIAKDILYDHDDHNTVRKRGRELVKRTSVYVPLYLRKRSFETDGGTATIKESLSASSIAGVLALPLFFTKLYVVPSAIWGAFLLLNLGFLYYVFKKESLLHAFYSLFASVYISTSIGLGIILGLFKFVSNRGQLG